MNQNMQQTLGRITDARFISIGADRQIVGGMLDGKTFYSEPIEGIDGDVVQTAKGKYRFISGALSNV